jgi:pimeloyl-ACP methyl ester carboxylesterase
VGATISANAAEPDELGRRNRRHIAPEAALVHGLFGRRAAGLGPAAFYPDRFGAFIALNGWYDNPNVAAAINNDIFRTPAISEDYPMSIILGGTSPLAPEATAQEVYWIYRSNFPVVYAGDNDYFMHRHDLGKDGNRVNARAKPVYVLCGEYDAASQDKVHGGPAVAAKVPGAVYLEAKGLGHFAPSDDPAAFEEMILPVLDEIKERVGQAARIAAPTGA